jgi:hypothetical protein
MHKYGNHLSGYVVEIFDTALKRVWRLVGIIPDVQVCIHEMKRKQDCEGIGVRECGSTDDKEDCD